MLRIESENKIADFYVGDVINCFVLRKELRDEDVTNIEASGDELLEIQKAFVNIPMSNNAVVFWKGEIAQFIVDNLPSSVFPSFKDITK